MKKEYYQASPTQGEGWLDFSSTSAHYVDKSPDIETEEVVRPRSPMSELSSKDCK